MEGRICVRCGILFKRKYRLSNSMFSKRKFCSRACGNKVVWNKGKNLSEEHKKSLRGKRPNATGENNYRWIKDRTLLKDDHRDRGGQLHREWSNDVKKRDGCKCKIDNQDCKGILEAHHILGWTSHSELRYIINNGITLCHFHHPRKRVEEKRLISFFQSMVEVIRT